MTILERNQKTAEALYADLQVDMEDILLSEQEQAIIYKMVPRLQEKDSDSDDDSDLMDIVSKNSLYSLNSDFQSLTCLAEAIHLSMFQGSLDASGWGLRLWSLIFATQ